jgi:hypothetical protein
VLLLTMSGAGGRQAFPAGGGAEQARADDDVVAALAEGDAHVERKW